ncbi:MAG: alpha/beta fold hydrolase [Candidatus Odinarchaeota archaeon]
MFAKNGDISINYQVEGDGKPVVLLHSHLSSLQMWYDGYVEYLSKKYKVLAIDIRGFGKSSKPHEPDAYEDEHLANDILAVLDQESLPDATVYGYSMGGKVVYACLKHAPDRITSAIIGGAPPDDMKRREQLILEQNRTLAMGMESYIEFLELRVGKQSEEMKTAILQNDPEAIVALNKHWLNQPGFTDEFLKNITCPVFLYAGTSDQPIHERLKHVSTLIPNCLFFEVPGANHQQAFIQKELVLPEIDKFLSTITKDEN